MRQGFGDALVEIGRENESVVVLDSDVGKSTRASDFGDAFPSRFFDCGVQEANMMAVAAGLAIEGFIPFATTFGVFATCRTMDQIRNSIAYPKLNVKIGATHCGITVGEDGASHQAIEDIALMRAVPNMTVVVPGDYSEAHLATKAAVGIDGPVYLRFGRGKHPLIEGLAEDFQIGKAKVLRRGKDVTIITTGIMVSEGLMAAELLEGQGCSARVIHMATIKPLDEEVLLRAAAETNAIITAEEHSVIGGLGEAVAGFLAEHHPAKVVRVGLQDEFGQSGTADDLMDYYGLRADNLAQLTLKLKS
ncbi:MAG: transketolase family protein [Phycisphaerae bacterium]|jgi:transketolase|nr:transketolase family protein [Phycisphaerae bacterium]